MLKFACIAPHPPLIVPTIGSQQDRKKVSKTIEALKKLGKIFEKREIETAIFVSPHGFVEYSCFSLNICPILEGNFSNFGDFETKFSFKNDLEIVELIKKNCQKQNIPYKLKDFVLLDHGTLVPAYYLLPKNFNGKIVPLSFSFLSKKINFEFGRVIGRTIEETKKNIGVIASGDLSHRLNLEAPAGFSPWGKIFDKKLVSFLKESKIKQILEMNDDLIKKAGECGYLSIVVLLGILAEKKNFKFDIMSYQGPFGVGYLVANVLGI